MSGVSWRTANKIFLLYDDKSSATILNRHFGWIFRAGLKLLQRTFVHLYLGTFSHEVEHKTQEVCCDRLTGAKISLEGIHFIIQNQQI